MKFTIALILLTLSLTISAQADQNIVPQKKLFYDDSNKFLHALTKATYHIDQGRMTIAHLWLRIAYEHAVSAEARKNIEKLNRRIANSKPYSIKFNFALSPSDNVNNGTNDEVVILGGLPFAIDNREKAYQGYVLDTSFLISYLMSQSARHRTDIVFQATSRTIRLSNQERQRNVGNIRGSDFNQSTLSVGASHLLRTSARLTPLNLQWDIGKIWYGGNHLSYQLNTTASQGYYLSDRLVLRGAGSLRRTIRQDSSSNSSTRKNISLGAQHSILNSTKLTYDFIYEHISSSSATIHSNAIAIAANLELPGSKMIKPIIQFQLEDRSFPNWNALGTVRSDKSTSASLVLGFSKIQKYGFSPRISFGLQRVNSNVSMYDRYSKSAVLSFHSSF